MKKLDLFSALFGPRPAEEKRRLPVVEASALGPAPIRYGLHDGDKYAGGFGLTEVLEPDYWTLRHRSAQLFRSNLYARGIVRRLITNEINTGLHLEALPEEGVLGAAEDSLSDWAEEVENRFHLWSKSPGVCDHKKRSTFGALQAAARLEALVSGDVLVVLVQDRRTRLPAVQLVRGELVQSPANQKAQRGHRIEHGVELDSQGRHVAYWIDQEDGTSRRLPAWGEKSGRRIAWLVYGTENRLDDVRGEPLLSLVLQSLREVDRYRDSAQRKAWINAILAMSIEKAVDKPGSRPLSASGIRRGPALQQDSQGKSREFIAVEHIPGLVVQELQVGETIKAHSSAGTDEKFSDFEAAIVHGVAWALEIPPEILTLSFSANYSASAAAIKEFKAYLDRIRNTFGETFCQPIYAEWLLSESLNGKISAPGLTEAWRDPEQHDVLAAWFNADWCGHIKPSTDVFKEGRGYALMLDRGLISHDRASREMTGTKFSKNVKKLKRELELLREAGLMPQIEPAGGSGGIPGGRSDDPDNDKKDN